MKKSFLEKSTSMVRNVTVLMAIVCFAMSAQAQSEKHQSATGLGMRVVAGSNYGGEFQYQWCHGHSRTDIALGVNFAEVDNADNLRGLISAYNLWSTSGAKLQLLAGPGLRYAMSIDGNGLSQHNLGLGVMAGPQYYFGSGITLGLDLNGYYDLIGNESTRGWGWNAGLTLSYRF